MKKPDYVAEFIARGGKVVRGPEGVAYGVDKAADKAKRRATRDARAIAERHVVIDHCGREHVHNGLGEWLS